MNILVVAAHPDDEVLGCGGSMAKWSQAGHEVHVLILAEGATSRDDVRNRGERSEELSALKSGACQAGEILSVKSVQVLDMPDNRMDSIDLLDVVKVIEREIEKTNPEMVVTHHAGDVNIDHRVIHEAVVTACRPLRDSASEGAIVRGALQHPVGFGSAPAFGKWLCGYM